MCENICSVDPNGAPANMESGSSTSVLTNNDNGAIPNNIRAAASNVKLPDWSNHKIFKCRDAKVATSDDILREIEHGIVVIVRTDGDIPDSNRALHLSSSKPIPKSMFL